MFTTSLANKAKTLLNPQKRYKHAQRTKARLFGWLLRNSRQTITNVLNKAIDDAVQEGRKQALNLN